MSNYRMSAEEERMDRLGILLDAEWETERIEKEKREGKKPLHKLFYFLDDLGFIHEIRNDGRKGCDRVVKNEEIVELLNKTYEEYL